MQSDVLQQRGGGLVMLAAGSTGMRTNSGRACADANLRFFSGGSGKRLFGGEGGSQPAGSDGYFRYITRSICSSPTCSSVQSCAGRVMSELYARVIVAFNAKHWSTHCTTATTVPKKMSEDEWG